MAASLVSHILSDPCVFRTWPHYQGIDCLQVLLVTEVEENLRLVEGTSN